MRNRNGLLSLIVLSIATPAALAQAGRYIPMPRLPVGGGAGGGAGHFIPHSLFHLGDDTLFWIIAAIIGVIVLAVIFCRDSGQDCGVSEQLPVVKPKASRRPSSTVWQTMAFAPIPDLILPSLEVAVKDVQTRRLMAFLARTDPALDPDELRSWIATTFTQVQKAWEARDYRTVKERLMPAILAKHEGLLKSMRKNHEINRMEDLHLERLEFVHLHCPQCVDAQLVTALITFRAKAYYVDDRTGAHTRGQRSTSWFQELWSFRRQGEGWLLQEIERSHESNRLERPNFVADLTIQQLANAQSSIAL